QPSTLREGLVYPPRKLIGGIGKNSSDLAWGGEMWNRQNGERARRALYAPGVLVVAVAAQDAGAATAQSREFQTPGSGTPTYTFNVVANNLVTTGSPPTPLVSAAADMPAPTI